MAWHREVHLCSPLLAVHLAKLAFSPLKGGQFLSYRFKKAVAWLLLQGNIRHFAPRQAPPYPTNGTDVRHDSDETFTRGVERSGPMPQTSAWARPLDRRWLR
jgi:hypothetical protein